MSRQRSQTENIVVTYNLSFDPHDIVRFRQTMDKFDLRMQNNFRLQDVSLQVSLRPFDSLLHCSLDPSYLYFHIKRCSLKKK